MKAMILAAGLGTRLKPLTDTLPKALVKVCGKPLLQWAVEKLCHSGVSEIIVNIHHFPDQVIDFIEREQSLQAKIRFSDERDELLDSGGGLMKAASFFDDGHPFVVYNVDVITSLDIPGMLERHQASGATVTLAVRNRKTSRYFLFDQDHVLCGWKNEDTGELRVSGPATGGLLALAFSGIHIISPGLFPLVTERGKFSLIDLYLRLASTVKIQAYPDNEGFWFDVGKPGRITEVEKHFQCR